MDFALSEMQEMLKKMARDFLTKECSKQFVREMEEDQTGYSPELWKEMAELGWMALPFPEKYGGSEGSFSDLIILLEEMGRACLPSPFIPTVVLSGLTILDIGSEEQKEKFLPGITKGDLICTLALTEPSDSYAPENIACKATRTGDGYVINGTKLFVSDAHIADYLLVATGSSEASTQESKITLFLIDSKSPGITCTTLKTMACDKQFEVVFDNVPVPAENMVGEEGHAWEGIQRTLQRAAVAKCAEIVGGAEQVLEMTVSYAKERIQFGRPIGSFQVIQHYCAEMVTDIDGSKFNTYKSAWLLDEGLPSSKQVAIAKAWASEAYHRITALGHQIHGTIAFTRDMDVELYVRRAKAAEIAFGDADYHREIIAQELGL